jgi:hypothetical protein
VIPVDPIPKSERSTLDLLRELYARRRSGDVCLGNRTQIALIENELDLRAKGIPA